MKKNIILAIALFMALGVFSSCTEEKEKKQDTNSNQNTSSEKKDEKSKEKTVYKLVALPNDGGEINKGTEAVVAEMNKALAKFNCVVEATAADDYAVVSESILTGTAHIGTPSGATYVKSHLENPNVIPLFLSAPKGVKEDSGYPAYIATHKDNAKDFENLSEEEAIKKLKGKSFAFVSATSTSGRLVPTTTFWKVFGPDGTKEIDKKTQVFETLAKDGGLFEEVQFGGTHPANVSLILNKKVYAGAFCCDYAGDDFDKFHIIAQVKVPNGPYWVNKEFMKEEHINALIEHFEKITPENAVEGMFVESDSPSDEVLTENDRWVRVDHSFYEFLEKMYEGE